MKEVLIVTGIAAEEAVKKYAKQSKTKSQVVTLPIQVAAFITPKFAARHLKQMGIKGFRCLLLPGLTFGDISYVSAETGIQAFKGPKHAADVPIILDNLDKIRFSTVTPACELMQAQIRAAALKELESIRKEALRLKRKDEGLFLGSGKRKVWTHTGYPMLLMAEVVNVSSLSSEEIRKWSEHYKCSGVDIIDIGLPSGGGNSEAAARAVRIAAEVASSKVISIDTNDVAEIEAGLNAGAKLVLSINGENMVEAAEVNLIRKTPIVITPADEHGRIPSISMERISQLEANIKKAETLGFNRIIADPLLSIQPPSTLTESISTYLQFKNRNPATPTFFGAGNFTELADADSIGLNFMLTLLAWELEASIIFTTEASDKTAGSAAEISQAIKMVTIASRRKTSPKDLGIHLLVLKEKRRREDEFKFDLEKAAVSVEASPLNTYTPDKLGFFKIGLDREHKKIIAHHYKHGEKNPDIRVEGKDVTAIYRRIIAEGKVSLLDHAAYLGCELQKATVALQMGRSYIQDTSLLG